MAAAQRPGKDQWNHMIAGGMAGSAAVLFLHPFDVIKTRLQVQDGASSSGTQYRNALHAGRTLLAQEGWRSFYKGLTPALIGSGVSWAAYFYIYEAIKAWHCSWQGRERLSPGWNMASAAQAGATVCLLTNPVWLIKTRLQLQRLPLAAAGGAAAAAASGALNAAGSAAAAAAAGAGGRHVLYYNGFLDALVRIGREEGLRGYYKGLGPSLLLQTTHGAIQFAVYDELKYFSSRTGRSPDEADRQPGSVELSLFAAASKLTASVSTYPSQVIRSRLQQRMDDGRTLVYRSAREAVRLTWQREGFGGFYKGLGPALLRVMPQSAVTLVAYEHILRFLDAASERRREEAAQAAVAAEA
ncbi:Mitochondrial folate transporter/carrier [Tetrabaena socialis]|uniref:Mitochondrial folate transporter/carrier n=1 Tax=Tetrabaena socialis TaxID=47790 RepID=A0A2J8AER5_9CHLO|nr:Mitochondrial folate transporter/carrier [Tetrabaena socialis]|eukprot:PNH11010.1 Mitochondrial folate transporter/carrier [Tetrabaena socialis]